MSLFASMKVLTKKSRVTRGGYDHVSEAVTNVFRLSPAFYARYRYRRTYGRWPNLNSPVTFDEKLLWLLLYWFEPTKSRCTDKYLVRDYVTERGFGHILPVLHGVYDRASDIDFDALPNRFVLKCTHGCGWNIICRDKKDLDVREAVVWLNTWMKTDYSHAHKEMHYASIKPRIICEEYLDDLANDQPNDYKVYCFGGHAHCTMVCRGRSQRLQQGPVFDFYDRAWEHKLQYGWSSLIADREVPKPDAYNEIVSAAEALSAPFPFVRMDFYDVQGRAVLGEMTFTPNGCIDAGYTELAQRELGALVALPGRRPPFLATYRRRRKDIRTSTEGS